MDAGAANADDSAFTLTCTVSNRGERAGAEVVQCYRQAPAGDAANPVHELCGVQRVELAPGESSVVQFRLTADDLATVDTEGPAQL